MKNNDSHSNDSLTRNDIHQYRTSKDEKVKHSIEKKVLNSDFDTDALDGWTNSAIGIEALKNIDKKFVNSSKIWIITGTISILIIGLIFIQQFNSSTPKNSVNRTTSQVIQPKLIEKTDVIIPEKIEQLREIPKHKQILVKTIQNDFKEKIEIESNTEIIEIDKLPTKTINERPENKSIIKKQFQAKEIYLNELKLIDYREYRSKPIIQSKQLIVSGTTANKEDVGSNDEENDWKNIEIPYIQYIDKTMAYFAKAEYKKTLTRLELILDTYPNDVNANFYAGLCYFNLKQNDKAIQSFENCLNAEFNNFNEEAEWYLSKTYEQSGDTDKAMRIQNSIRNKGGYYAKFLKIY